MRSNGRAPRQKGNRTERALRHYLMQRGFTAERVPLSGSAGGRFAGDLMLALAGLDFVVEVKARGDGFVQLYSWLDGRDMLIVKADRRDPLVILPLSLAAEIATRANEPFGSVTLPRAHAKDERLDIGVVPRPLKME